LSIVLLVLAHGATQGHAQQQSSSRIERLRGGNIGMNLKWSGTMFSGLGTRSAALSGSITTLHPGAAAISSNPAGLGFAKGLSVLLDWAPPLEINPDGLLKFEDKVNDSLNETAKDNSTTGQVLPGTVEDAVVNSKLDMLGGLKGGALMYGNPYMTLAFSFYQPFRLEAQFNVSGIEFLAAALNSAGDETHRIFGTVNGNLNMNLNIELSSIGIGRKLFDNLSVGLVYDQFNGAMDFEGTFLPEGIISSAGGDTRAFNDPARIQYDSLFAVMKGNWEGTGHRFRVGLGYHPTPRISLDAVFTASANIDLRGPFSMTHNNIRALNLNAEGDEEVFDVGKLVEDNLTQTEKKVTRIPGIDLELPGSVTLGFSAEWSHFLASATYTGYFDNLAYRFSHEQFDSLMTKTDGGEVHQGLKLGSAFRFAIGVEQLLVGGGVLFLETFKETRHDDRLELDISKRDNLFVPFFSLGGGVDMGSRFRLDYVATLFSSSFLRFSTSYRF